MVALIWVRGLIAHRPARILATVLGVAVGVALIAAIGTFLSATTSRMTQRAIARVPVDWQVQAQTGARPSAVLSTVRGFPGVSHALPVSFTTAPSLTKPTHGSTQTTGAAQILGLPAGYARTFPQELRLLTGSLNGPLLAQQTASNLHAAPGSSVTVALAGGRTARVKIAGVVDLPSADSLFQTVGAPPELSSRRPPTTCCCCPRRRSPASRHACSPTAPS